MTAAVIMLFWAFAATVIGIVVGAFIHFGRGDDDAP